MAIPYEVPGHVPLREAITLLAQSLDPKADVIGWLIRPREVIDEVEQDHFGYVSKRIPATYAQVRGWSALETARRLLRLMLAEDRTRLLIVSTTTGQLLSWIDTDWWRTDPAWDYLLFPDDIGRFGGRPYVHEQALDIQAPDHGPGIQIAVVERKIPMETESSARAARLSDPLKPASEASIHDCIAAIYAHATQQQMHPPNVKEIGPFVLDLLRRDGLLTTQNRVEKLSGDPRYQGMRAKPGVRRDPSFLPFDLEHWPKSGSEN